MLYDLSISRSKSQFKLMRTNVWVPMLRLLTFTVKYMVFFIGNLSYLLSREGGHLL